MPVFNPHTSFSMNYPKAHKPRAHKRTMKDQNPRGILLSDSVLEESGPVLKVCVVSCIGVRPSMLCPMSCRLAAMASVVDCGEDVVLILSLAEVACMCQVIESLQGSTVLVLGSRL